MSYTSMFPIRLPARGHIALYYIGAIIPGVNKYILLQRSRVEGARQNPGTATDAGVGEQSHRKAANY